MVSLTQTQCSVEQSPRRRHPFVSNSFWPKAIGRIKGMRDRADKGASLNCPHCLSEGRVKRVDHWRVRVHKRWALETSTGKPTEPIPLADILPLCCAVVVNLETGVEAT